MAIMTRDEFIDYILHTPENTNRGFMENMLKEISNNEDKNILFDLILKSENNINLNVLDQYLDRVFGDFGPGITYTLRIDTTNSDPLTCCEYLDGAAGMVKGSSDWDSKPIFNEIKPCILKEGKVVYYLDPTDYSKKVDGTAAVLDGTDGDVMVEFNKFAYRIYSEDNYTYISISNDANTIASDLRFKYLPFTRNSEGDVNKTYIGAYHGTVVDGKLRSISNSIPTVNITIGDSRTAAQANGVGYEQLTFYQMTMLQCLYLIRYGNLNSQNALGMGYTMAEEITTTGNTNASGMYSGNTTDGTIQVKFAGIEDFYGNIGNFVDGMYCDENYHALAATTGFNNDLTGYTDLGSLGFDTDTAGILKTIQGSTELGFIPKTVVGEDQITENSFNENFSDFAGAYAGCFASFGAFFDFGVDGGAFCLALGAPADDAVSIVGARLSYY